MTVIWIKLEIEGDDDDDAMGVVDDALDNGCMVDALNEYASDNGKDLGEVTSALAHFDPAKLVTEPEPSAPISSVPQLVAQLLGKRSGS